MKNNEFNNVKISNEKSTVGSEFTVLPKFEHTSVAETAKQYKDELNSRKINNDDISATSFKNRDKRTGLKKDYKEIKQGTTHLASTAGHAVIAATTVSIAVVATVVGFDIIQDNSKKDLIVFVNSEIGTNSISFSFLMPIKLMSYDEAEQTGGDMSIDVIAKITNSDYESDDIYFDWKDYDEDYYLFDSGIIGGLNPGTDYALTVNLYKTYYLPDQDEPVEVITELAFRSFTTKTIAREAFFNILSTTCDMVDFEVRVLPSVVNYSTEEPITEPDYLYIELEKNGKVIDEYWGQGVYEEGDDGYLISYGSFSNLDPANYYTMVAYVTGRDQETRQIAAIGFSTSMPEVDFLTIEAGSNSVDFSFIIPNTYLDEMGPTGSTSNNVYVVITNDSGYYYTSYISDYRSYDDNNSLGIGSFSQLNPDTLYKLRVYVTMETENRLLGIASFTTLEASYGFRSIDIQDEISFYQHEFNVTLNYYDTGETTAYSDFALTLKNNNYSTLGTLSLAAQTTEQTVSVPASIELTNVYYYSLAVYNNLLGTTQTLVENEEITFIDTDETTFNGFDSPYAFIGSSSGGYLPIKLDFVDTAHNYDDGFTLTASAFNNFTADLEATTDWQYAVLTGDALSRYSGDTFEIVITSKADGTTLYSESSVLNEDTNFTEFYSFEFTDTDVEQNDTTISFKSVYLYGYTNASFVPQLLLVNRTTGDQFLYELPVTNVPTNAEMQIELQRPISGPDGATFSPYSALAQTLGDMYDVYIRYEYNSSTDTPDKLFCEDVTFNFA